MDPPCPWRTQVVIVKDDENKKKRMCVDYPQTSNLDTELNAYYLTWKDDLIYTLASYNVFSTFNLRSQLRSKRGSRQHLLGGGTLLINNFFK